MQGDQSPQIGETVSILNILKQYKIIAEAMNTFSLEIIRICPTTKINAVQLSGHSLKPGTSAWQHSQSHKQVYHSKASHPS